MQSKGGLGDGEILSVSQFTGRIKSLLEKEIPSTWIRGEVSNLSKQASGHYYFTLKDSGSQLSCVLFRGNATGMSLQLKDGLQILVYGEISLYEPRGSYQVIVRLALDDGVGKLQLAYEVLKKKLSDDGLFDASRKKAIPLFPKTIGIITSPTGAAIHDFISILKRRKWTGRVVVLPALVQGQEAAANIREQIQRALKLDCFNLLVLARGGGSLEDLWPFNDEGLIRDLAECSIPTISAVGHEIDFMLCDFVADRRAETPSAAAEIITQPYLELVNQLKALQQRLQACSPKRRLEYSALRLDELRNRLTRNLQNRIFDEKDILAELKSRLQALSPEKIIEISREKLYQLQRRMATASVETQLNRGFALIKNETGQILSSKKDLRAGDKLTVVFSDGPIKVIAID